MEYGKPTKLYESSDLLEGYRRDDPMAFASSWDFQTFCGYVADGSTTPKSLDVRRAQADHDAHIAEALKNLLDTNPKPKLVGVMGGHGISRSAPAYAAVARLGQYLTKGGYLVVTGGGPGAMEAAHLEALFAHGSEDELKAAVAALSQVADLPNLNDIVTATGDIAPGREADLDKARRWMNAALEVKDRTPTAQGASLAIPTWLYGQEPTMPFATHYAKYFQNSIREEALITQSRAGIIYAQGGGGTMREVFEDAEQNYYAKTSDDFTPVIFFDPDGFWQHAAEFDAGGMTRRGLRIDDLMIRLFRYGRRDSAACLKKVRFTTDFAIIDSVLRAHSPVAQRNLEFSLAGEPLKVSFGVFDRGSPERDFA
ncbi:LOG family protein [Bradyrhizobium sp. USDA 4451]